MKKAKLIRTGEIIIVWGEIIAGKYRAPYFGGREYDPSELIICEGPIAPMDEKV